MRPRETWTALVLVMAAWDMAWDMGHGRGFLEQSGAVALRAQAAGRSPRAPATEQPSLPSRRRAEACLLECQPACLLACLPVGLACGSMRGSHGRPGWLCARFASAGRGWQQQQQQMQMPSSIMSSSSSSSSATALRARPSEADEDGLCDSLALLLQLASQSRPQPKPLQRQAAGPVVHCLRSRGCMNRWAEGHRYQQL